jgi:hypothetical protein
MCHKSRKRRRPSRFGAPSETHPPSTRERSERQERSKFETMKTCDFCGRQEADETKTLAWSTSVENGRAKTFCESCSRENLRAMEGKLDSEYW